MAKLYLVRHGKATAGWSMEKDPGLDDLGHAQAKATALKLAPLDHCPLSPSPLSGQGKPTNRPTNEGSPQQS
jgi:broad specificity phosphatase PhoE